MRSCISKLNHFKFQSFILSWPATVLRKVNLVDLLAKIGMIYAKLVFKY